MSSSRKGPATLPSSAKVEGAPETGHWLVGATAILVAAGLFVSVLMGALDQLVVLTALPNIVADLGRPNSVTFVVSAYLIASTVAIPVFARLSDILSRRNVFIASVLVFIAGSALAGLSQSLNELIAFRAVQGFGSGGFFPVGLSLIAVAYSPAQRARLTGVISGVFGIATVAGPFLGSYIVDHTSWRWVFYINIPVGIVGVLVLGWSLSALRPHRRESFDVTGALLLSAWVGALMFALVQVSNAGWGWMDPRVLSLLLSAAVSLVAFVWFELRVTTPLVPLRLLRDRVIASSSAVSALSQGAVFALSTVISVYVGVVVYHGGSGAADAVRNMLYFLVLPMVLGAVLGGQVLTRVAYRPLVLGGTLVAAFGLYLLTYVTPNTPIWQFGYGFLPTGGLIVPLIPIGFGSGMTFASLTLSAQFRVPERDVGQATGLVRFMGTLGVAVGLSVFSAFQTWRLSGLQPSPPSSACLQDPTPACEMILAAYQNALEKAIVASYTEVFAIMLALMVIAAVASLFLIGRMPRST